MANLGVASCLSRSAEEAADKEYDLIVVGGGIYGVALVFEAARRGLCPLLLERHDYGGGTSWNSLRIVHGGLRYLQTMDIRRHSISVCERRWFLRNFPEYVQPLPCVMPLYSVGTLKAWQFQAAFALDTLMSPGRNWGLTGDQALPSGSLLGPDNVVEAHPGVDRAGLVGAARWYDARMTQPQRIIIELLKWATRCGATALNYVEAVKLDTSDNRVMGLKAVDRRSGQVLAFRASAVVNCAGPCSRSLARLFDRDVPALFRPSLAFNLLLDRSLAGGAALAISTRRPGARTYFVYPTEDGLMAGTYHAPTMMDASSTPSASMVDDFLREINGALPSLRVERRHILRVYSGLLPVKTAGSVALETREVILHHAHHGGPVGLFSVSGVKFTTARAVALNVLRNMKRVIGWKLARPNTVERRDAGPNLHYRDFLDLVKSDRAQAQKYVSNIVDAEAVTRPEDFLLRRTNWCTDPRRRKQTERLLRSLAPTLRYPTQQSGSSETADGLLGLD